MAELEELEQEDLDAQLLEISGPVVDELPSVPTAEPSSSSKTRCLSCMTPQNQIHVVMFGNGIN